jgi:hypothetical protein
MRGAVRNLSCVAQSVPQYQLELLSQLKSHFSSNRNADAALHRIQQPTTQAVYGVSPMSSANSPQRQVVQVGYEALVHKTSQASALRRGARRRSNLMLTSSALHRRSAIFAEQAEIAEGLPERCLQRDPLENGFASIGVSNACCCTKTCRLRGTYPRSRKRQAIGQLREHCLARAGSDLQDCLARARSERAPCSNVFFVQLI